MLDIRPATPDDLDALTELITASYSRLDPSLYAPGRLAAVLPLMSKANPKLLASGTYYVVSSDGEAAGCGGWTFEAPGTGILTDGVAHIRHFATHPDHLRKGVARLLIDRCCTEAAARGARLMKSQSTLQGEAFYSAAGFRRLRPIEVKFTDEISLAAIEMERPLP
jgi:GNAT superfamily N-acetyltransferase